jgi:hypothetical protein
MAPMPYWKTAKVGSRKKVALWLAQEVKPGNVFTKAQLRDAFPDVQQIDRRMRDLRDDGWQIDTNREDASLGAHELRFVRQGLPVWEQNVQSAGTMTFTANQRREILQRDSHICRSCGIGPGEPYPDNAGRSQLDIARRSVRLPDGTEQKLPVTECTRCRIGRGKDPADVGRLLGQIDRLSPIERRMLADWVSKGHRDFGTAEHLWGEYASLPAEARKAVQDALS